MGRQCDGYIILTSNFCHFCRLLGDATCCTTQSAVERRLWGFPGRVLGDCLKGNEANRYLEISAKQSIPVIDLGFMWYGIVEKNLKGSLKCC